MEKYVIFLFITTIACAFLLLAPVRGREADRTYLVCSASAPEAVRPSTSPVWRTKEFCAYLLEGDTLVLAGAVPYSRTVREYFFDTVHSLSQENAWMQVCRCATHTRCGVPYLLD